MRQILSVFLFLGLLFSTSLPTAYAAFCKCICFDHFEIVPLYRPSDPSKPCLSCTKQFCLDQKLDICKDASLGEVDYDVGTGEEGDVQTRCFGACCRTVRARRQLKLNVFSNRA